MVRRRGKERQRERAQTYPLGLWGEEASLCEEDSAQHNHDDLADSLHRRDNGKTTNKLLVSICEDKTRDKNTKDKNEKVQFRDRMSSF